MKKPSVSKPLFFLVLSFVLFFVLNAVLGVSEVKISFTLLAAVVTLVCLASGVVKEYLAVLGFLAVMAVLKIVPTDVIFSGFASDGFWLIFAGLVLSLAVKEVGLAARLSHSLMRCFKGRYFTLVLGMMLLGVLVAFIMPSAMSRVVLLLPILMEFANANGFFAGTKGYNGLVLAGVFSTYMIGFAILPSNLPNIILIGAMNSIYHVNLAYGHYLLVNFPVLGLLKLIALGMCIQYFFHDTPVVSARPDIKKERLSSSAARLLVYLVVLLLAWLLDSLVQLSPAWPALLMAVICLLPKVGALDHHELFKKANLQPLFYVGGLISLGAIINHTGIGHLLGQRLLHALPLSAQHQALNVYLLSILTSLLGMVTTLPGVPAVFTPLSGLIAKLTHLPLSTVALIQVNGFANFLLPYQAPPIIIALRLARVPFSVTTKLCVVLFCLTLIVLLPLDIVWWKALSLIQ